MGRFVRFVGARVPGLYYLRSRVLTPGRVMACMSLVGLAGLSYLAGAAVMYFQLPPADYLEKAFVGAEAWQERRSTPPSPPPPEDGSALVGVDKPGKTYDGFTLYTTTQGTRALLLDMRGNVVHQWELPFRRAWPRPAHVRRPVPENRIHWFRCYLYPNGDLLAVYHASGDTPYGYGLAKMDKDSKPLWAYPGRAHHDVDVGEDGTIYALTQDLVKESPAGLDFLRGPYIADSVVALSPEGEERERVPVLEAFRDSPYSLLLEPAGLLGPARATRPRLTSAPQAKGDVLHTNCVRVLGRALAPKFPLFKAGQVLTSLRALNAVAVLDLHTRSVAWAARGPWRAQHDPEFLENGHLLLFDNAGSRNGARVLEYDPVTQALPWAYASENSPPFEAKVRGMKQRLPNGNTLVVRPDDDRFFEVTPDKELVWECRCPFSIADEDDPKRAVTGARRYGPHELTFLKGDTRARP